MEKVLITRKLLPGYTEQLQQDGSWFTLGARDRQVISKTWLCLVDAGLGISLASTKMHFQYNIKKRLKTLFCNKVFSTVD